MGHKVHPTGFRLGTIKDWKSRWFDRKNQQAFLEEDYRLRNYIEEKLEGAAVESIIITRSGNAISIAIHSARPGIVIGRGGSGMEDLRKGIRGLLQKIANERGVKFSSTIKLDVEEIRHPESYARLVAKNIAEQLERRLPFRRTMKKSIERVMQQKDVKGAKIALAGRLGGGEYARTEQLSEGTIPLSTLRADIDYAFVEAGTTYGAIGVKVWLYKGEKFDSEVGEEKKI